MNSIDNLSDESIIVLIISTAAALILFLKCVAAIVILERHDIMGIDRFGRRRRVGKCCYVKSS